MPPNQVYGKRSRAVYDPFQAFVSPQRPAPSRNIKDQGVFVAEVVEELTRLKVSERRSAGNGKRSERKALGEKSVNETVEPVKAVADHAKARQRRRKVVEEDEENVKSVEPTPRTHRRPSPVQSKPRERVKDGHAAKTGDTFIADGVPMFIDGHGYDTEDEDTAPKSPHKTPTTTLEPSVNHAQTVDLEAPSISILPPTPPAEKDENHLHCASLLSLSSHGITNFTEWSNELTSHFSIDKIAEASFGEVYRLSLLEDLSSFSHSDESVLKIIALRPTDSSLPTTSKKKEHKAILKRSEAMSKVEDVANEVKLLQRMSTIPGFTNFRDVRIMQGRPPQPFIKAFKDFNAGQKARKKEASVFPDPAKKASYPEDQLWAVIEMQDAGTDLERYVEQAQCQSIWIVWDVFWQVVLTLAKGEEGAEFEHRDLHLGNVCVRLPSTASASQATKTEIDTKRKLKFTALETTIIDYTISRALLSSSSPSSSPSASRDIAFHDLSTPTSQSIFEGDGTEEYQYDIYRYMRGCVVAGDPYYNPSETTLEPHHPLTPNVESQWPSYHPRTNLIWLHYLLHTLLEQLHWPSASKAPTRKKNAGKDFQVWKRANDLEHVLLRVQELLDPGVVCGVEGLASAGALVVLALEEGWLDEGDVVGDDSTTLSGGDEDVDATVDLKVVGEGNTLGEVRITGQGEQLYLDGTKNPARSRRKGG